MSEKDVKAVDAEVVVETDQDKMLALIKDVDKPVFNVMQNVDSLNWKDLKPNQTAILLMQRPMAVSGGGTLFLNFKQALFFAVRCYELGVSPFSSSVWFDPNRFSVNLTLEGKREVARIKGIDLGPPQFTEISREWNEIPRATEVAESVKKLGFSRDVGVRCSIRVGDPKHNEYVSYAAYLSEWYVPRSPVWQAKPMHMLQTRATEKAISLAMGTGASSMPDERELGE